jgi:hypothetical protein
VQKYKKITSSGQFFKKKIPATVWRYFQQRPDGRWSAPTPPFGHPFPPGRGITPAPATCRRMKRMEHDGMEQTASRSLCVCEDADTSMPPPPKLINSSTNLTP